MTGHFDRPIAILGATSRLAIDFIVETAPSRCFALYARRPKAVRQMLEAQGLPESYAAGTLADFERHATSREHSYSAIMNFVGVGDPAKASALGAEIFSATLESDRIARSYAAVDPETPYVFLSSGAVYGTDFSSPADEATPAVVPVNVLTGQHYYTVAKLHAEAVHRSCADSTIIDVRIFNYVSRRLDLSNRFLIMDIARAIIEGKIFETTRQTMYRDYLGPQDMAQLLLACANAPAGTNKAVDAYSKAPVGKEDLLETMARALGLRYRYVETDSAVNATGAKPSYFSLNRAAATLGYVPRNSSEDAVIQEVGALIRELSNR